MSQVLERGARDAEMWCDCTRQQWFHKKKIHWHWCRENAVRSEAWHGSASCLTQNTDEEWDIIRKAIQETFTNPYIAI